MDEVFGIVRRTQADGVTVLLIEQNVAKALALADDAHVLERGRLVAGGRASDVLHSSRVQTAYLGTGMT